MFRIVDIKNGMYGVLDTKDKRIEYVTGYEVMRAVNMGLTIQGVRVSDGHYYLSVYNPKRRKRVHK